MYFVIDKNQTAAVRQSSEANYKNNDSAKNGDV